MLILWETGSEQLMDDANRNVAAVLTPCELYNDCQAGNADGDVTVVLLSFGHSVE
jgi:hypothetical protein